jgi:hypothetical protein
MRTGSRPPGRYNGKRPFQQQQRPPQRNLAFDSNGPNVKIRGNAPQIFERYVALAREAEAGGDRVAAENFYQHAEHYFRVSSASRDGNQQGMAPRPTTPADAEMNPSQTGPIVEYPSNRPQARPQWDDNDSASPEPFIR